MDRNMRVEISKGKKDDNSFLVSLIPLPALPAEMKKGDFFTECAVVAVNDVDGNEIFSAVHLEADEKDKIGHAIADKCAPMGEWLWCNLYV